MTDKVEKIREEVKRLKSQLLRGACSSQVTMETRCKEEAYNEVLAILDTMQKEPVSKQNLSNVQRTVKNWKEPISEDFEKIVEEIAEPTILNAYGTKELARRLRNTICGTSVSEDLGEYINELSKQFPEVSFAKLSRIAVRVSRWQRNQDTKNKLPKVINRTDLDEYAYQVAYDLSNDWAKENPTWHDVEDACKLGANWQKEQMMAKAVEGEILEAEDDDCAICLHTHLELYIEPDTLEKNGFKDNDKVKVIVIKEE